MLVVDAQVALADSNVQAVGTFYLLLEIQLGVIGVRENTYWMVSVRREEAAVGRIHLCVYFRGNEKIKLGEVALYRNVAEPNIWDSVD